MALSTREHINLYPSVTQFHYNLISYDGFVEIVEENLKISFVLETKSFLFFLWVAVSSSTIAQNFCTLASFNRFNHRWLAEFGERSKGCKATAAFFWLVLLDVVRKVAVLLCCCSPHSSSFLLIIRFSICIRFLQDSINSLFEKEKVSTIFWIAVRPLSILWMAIMTSADVSFP